MHDRLCYPSPMLKTTLGSTSSMANLVVTINKIKKMDIKKFSQTVGDLVGKNELQGAITLLHRFLKDSPKLDDVIMQSSQLSDIMRQIRNGVVSLEDANVTKNKIRMGILSLANEIEEIVLNDENLKNELVSKNESENKPFIQQIHYGNGDNVGGNKIINK